MSLKSYLKKRPYLLMLVPVMLLLIGFVVLPLAWILRVSFYQNIPGGYMQAAFVWENYQKFLLDFWYLKNVLGYSLCLAIGTTFLSVLLAYPLTMTIAGCQGRMKRFLYTLTLSPLLIGIVCLIYGWIVIFRGHGLLNQLTMFLGLTSEPIKYMYNTPGVVICLVYVSIPFVVLNLLDSLERINPSLKEAAMNVGANRWQSFLKVTLPLSIPGAFSGSLVAFALNYSAFSIPLMVGSERTHMIGLVIFNQTFKYGNLPFAAAVSVVMVVTSAVILSIFMKLVNTYYLRRLGV